VEKLHMQGNPCTGPVRDCSVQFPHSKKNSFCRTICMRKYGIQQETLFLCMLPWQHM
jgi:hypothetical protein